MEGTEDCMDSTIRTEFNKLWEDVSELDKYIAILQFQVKATCEQLTDIKKDLEEFLDQKWTEYNKEKDRSNNIKIAIIGALAVLVGIIPSIINVINIQSIVKP